MSGVKTSRRRSWFSILGAILCLLAFAAPASAKSGQILPPTAKPKGYSLVEAAAATAYFNTGARSEDELPEDFPFEILYAPGAETTNTIRVKPGTAFYVPVVHDESLHDVSDPQVVQDLYFDPANYGAEYVHIVVDGEVTSLEPAYAVGVATPGLREGIDNYTVIGAFLSPLSRGTHTVTVAGRFTGDALGGEVFEFEITYTVIVG